MKPIIVVLDWDGTIVGRVDYQSQIFTLNQTLKTAGIRPASPISSNANAFGPDNILVRPYFVQFIKTLQDLYGIENIHFFIYTASSKTWALQEIGWVEKLYNIKFAKPIFTRDDCLIDRSGNYKKSLIKIFPRICRSIGITGPALRKEIFENNIIIIDNRAVYIDSTDKLLLCPDYDYLLFENLLDYIPREAHSKNSVQQLIHSWVNEGLLCPQPNINKKKDPMRTLAKQYSWLATKCKSTAEANKVYESDDFWAYLTKIIIQNDLKIYSGNVIKQLEKAVWARAKKQ